MNASIVKRTLAIAAAVAVPWIGCSLWSARRERAEKETLAAEIRAEMAARKAARPATSAAGPPDRTSAYLRILQGMREPASVDLVQDALARDEPWPTVPPAITEYLEANAAIFEGLETEVALDPPGCIDLASHGDWNPWLRARRLLSAQGRARAATGDLNGILDTVRVLRRLAVEFLNGSGSLPGPIPIVFASAWEGSALDLLALAAVHPALDEALATEGLRIVEDARAKVPRVEASLDRDREEFDRLCLEFLGEDADAAFDRWRGENRPTVLDRLKGVLESKEEVRLAGPSAPPSPDVLRRMREGVAAFCGAAARREGAWFLPGGTWKAVTEDLGGGWKIERIFWTGQCRLHWRREARLDVLRSAFGLRLHELRNGRTPGTLGDLVPTILDAVPVDAWTSEPMRFTRKPAGGWVLEARPPDLMIDHGDGDSEELRPFRLER